MDDIKDGKGFGCTIDEKLMWEQHHDGVGPSNARALVSLPSRTRCLCSGGTEKATVMYVTANWELLSYSTSQYPTHHLSLSLSLSLFVQRMKALAGSRRKEGPSSSPWLP